MQTDEETNTAKLIAAFPNYGNKPKNAKGTFWNSFYTN
jgi:hypothetical protein